MYSSTINKNIMTNKLCIIVITYNAEKWLDKCFNIFRNNPEVKILAIDNCSTDNTISILKENFQHVKIIKTNTNLGFGKANNIGLKYALENKFEHVLLLNQDAWISEADVYKLIDIQKNNPDYYIISPLHFNGLGNNLDEGFSHYMNLYAPELCNDAIVGKYSKDVYNSTFCNAACWLLSKKCLEEIGGFNPSFHHYGEDDNYLHRLFYHNKKLGIVPTCKCFHDRENRPENKTFFNDFSTKYRIEILIPLSNPNNKKIHKTELNLFKKYTKNLIKNLVKLKFDKSFFYFSLLQKLYVNRKQILQNREISKNTNCNFLSNK